MGVQGLLKYILSTPSTREKIQLRQFAKAHLEKTGKRPELLCDFTSVVQWLLSSYDYAMMERELESPYCLLHGGVLKHYTERVLSFVRILQSLGLEVVFCVESTPVSKEEMDVFYSVYAERCSKKVQNAFNILQVCTSNLEMTQMPWAWREGVASHVIFTLESSRDVRVMYCEKNMLVKTISYMQAHKHVCGILSHDTSYAIASGCGLFLIDLFQLDVHQPSAGLPALEPEQDLKCEVVWNTWLAGSLDLTMQQLADLAILSGNRYTESLNAKLCLPQALGITGMGVIQLAEWLRTQDSRLANIPSIVEFLSTNVNYCKAIELSYCTYQVGHKQFNSDALLQDFPSLNEIVSRGGVLSPQMISAVSNYTYWRGVLIEPQIPNCPCFNDVTLIIRMYIYSLLGLSCVNEYGFITAATSPAQIPVDVVSSDVKFVAQLSTNERLGVLHHLITSPQMLETSDDFHTIVSEGASEGQEVTEGVPVTEVLLFAALVFMRDSNMRIKPSPNILMCELDALVTTLLCSLAGLPPLRITHIPPPKGVTVASWFSHLLDQIYWLAACLGLSCDLPAPGHLFSSHQYVLFHLASTLCEDFAPESFPPVCPKLRQVCTIYQDIWELNPVLDLRVELLKDAPTSLARIMEVFAASVEAISSSSALQEMINELKCTSLPILPSPLSSTAARTKEAGVEGREKFLLDLDDYNTSSGDSALSLIREELSFSQERCATEENQFFSSQSLCSGGGGALTPCDLQGVESLEEEEVEEAVVEEEEEEDMDSIFDDEWSELEGSGWTVSQSHASKMGGDEGLADAESVKSKGPIERNSNTVAERGEEGEEATPVPKIRITPPTSRVAKTSRQPPEAELPIMAHRSRILELVHAHTVVCIEGETGCGKSTKVPQFILDDSLANSAEASSCRILVTQPRRVAAMKLAERVSGERGERLGKTVGYCVGGDHHRAAQTRLTYCTVGYLLQVLVHNPSAINWYSHIILDEIHERCTDTDFALLVVRKLVSETDKVKIVIMSATMQGSLLIGYFEEIFPSSEISSPYFVGAKRYPVQTYFIDQLDSLLEEKVVSHWHRKQEKSCSILSSLLRSMPKENLKEAISTPPRVTDFTMCVAIHVIVLISKLGESILVFLPGIASISKFYEMLAAHLESEELSRHFRLFILHSQVALEDQKDAFLPPSSDTIHVILATNIAESSITLPKLRMVVNFGIFHQLQYDKKRHVTCLKKKWCSQSSSIQRAGRAGRVFDGIAVHLVSSRFYEIILPQFDQPEILNLPLAKLVLQAKMIGKKLGVPSPSELLCSAIEQPSLEQLEVAMQDLADLGAVASHGGVAVSEEADITMIGYFSLSLPVDLPLSRLVLFSVFFGIPFEGITIAASLSLYQDVFSLPSRVILKDDKAFQQQLRRSTEARAYFDQGHYSEAVMVCNMFREWVEFRNNHLCSAEAGDKGKHALIRSFCRNSSVRWERLLQMEASVATMAGRVASFLPKNHKMQAELLQLASLSSFTQQPLNSDPRAGGGKRKRRKQLRESEKKFKAVDVHFCNNPVTIKALMAAAFTNQTIMGVAGVDSHQHAVQKRSRNHLEVIKSSCMDPAETLVIPTLRDPSLSSLFQLVTNLLPHRHFNITIQRGCGYVTLMPAFGANPKTALMREQAASRGENLVPTEPQNSMWNPFMTEISVARNKLAPDLVHLWQFGERRVEWGVSGVKEQYRRPQHPLFVSWRRLTASGESAHAGNWRQPTTVLLAEEGEDNVYIGVAATMNGSDNQNLVNFRGSTLLPNRDCCTALLLVLAFQPLSTPVSFLVSPAKGHVVGMKIDNVVIPFCDSQYLTRDDLVRINALRSSISTVLCSFCEDDTLFPMDDISRIHSLLDCLLSRSPTNLTSEPPKSPDLAGLGKLLEWDMVQYDTNKLGDNFFEEFVYPDLENFCYYPQMSCGFLSGVEVLQIPESQLRVSELFRSDSVASKTSVVYSLGKDRQLRQRVESKLSPLAKQFVPSSHYLLTTSPLPSGQALKAASSGGGDDHQAPSTAMGRLPPHSSPGLTPAPSVPGVLSFSSCHHGIPPAKSPLNPPPPPLDPGIPQSMTSPGPKESPPGQRWPPPPPPPFLPHQQHAGRQGPPGPFEGPLSPHHGSSRQPHGAELAVFRPQPIARDGPVASSYDVSHVGSFFPSCPGFGPVCSPFHGHFNPALISHHPTRHSLPPPPLSPQHRAALLQLLRLFMARYRAELEQGKTALLPPPPPIPATQGLRVPELAGMFQLPVECRWEVPAVEELKSSSSSSAHEEGEDSVSVEGMPEERGGSKVNSASVEDKPAENPADAKFEMVEGIPPQDQDHLKLVREENASAVGSVQTQGLVSMADSELMEEKSPQVVAAPIEKKDCRDAGFSGFGSLNTKPTTLAAKEEKAEQLGYAGTEETSLSAGNETEVMKEALVQETRKDGPVVEVSTQELVSKACKADKAGAPKAAKSVDKRGDNVILGATGESETKKATVPKKSAEKTRTESVSRREKAKAQSAEEKLLVSKKETAKTQSAEEPVSRKVKESAEEPVNKTEKANSQAKAQSAEGKVLVSKKETAKAQSAEEPVSRREKAKAQSAEKQVSIAQSAEENVSVAGKKPESVSSVVKVPKTTHESASAEKKPQSVHEQTTDKKTESTSKAQSKRASQKKAREPVRGAGDNGENSPEKANGSGKSRKKWKSLKKKVKVEKAMQAKDKLRIQHVVKKEPVLPSRSSSELETAPTKEELLSPTDLWFKIETESSSDLLSPPEAAPVQKEEASPTETFLENVHSPEHLADQLQARQALLDKALPPPPPMPIPGSSSAPFPAAPAQKTQHPRPVIPSFSTADYLKWLTHEGMKLIHPNNSPLHKLIIPSSISEQKIPNGAHQNPRPSKKSVTFGEVSRYSPPPYQPPVAFAIQQANQAQMREQALEQSISRQQNSKDWSRMEKKRRELSVQFANQYRLRYQHPTWTSTIFCPPPKVDPNTVYITQPPQTNPTAAYVAQPSKVGPTAVQVSQPLKVDSNSDYVPQASVVDPSAVPQGDPNAACVPQASVVDPSASSAVPQRDPNTAHLPQASVVEPSAVPHQGDPNAVPSVGGSSEVPAVESSAACISKPSPEVVKETGEREVEQEQEEQCDDNSSGGGEGGSGGVPGNTLNQDYIPPVGSIWNCELSAPTTGPISSTSQHHKSHKSQKAAAVHQLYGIPDVLVCTFFQNYLKVVGGWCFATVLCGPVYRFFLSSWSTSHGGVGGGTNQVQILPLTFFTKYPKQFRLCVAGPCHQPVVCLRAESDGAKEGEGKGVSVIENGSVPSEEKFDLDSHMWPGLLESIGSQREGVSTAKEKEARKGAKGTGSKKVGVPVIERKGGKERGVSHPRETGSKKGGVSRVEERRADEARFKKEGVSQPRETGSKKGGVSRTEEKSGISRAEGTRPKKEGVSQTKERGQAEEAAKGTSSHPPAITKQPAITILARPKPPVKHPSPKQSLGVPVSPSELPLRVEASPEDCSQQDSTPRSLVESADEDLAALSTQPTSKTPQTSELSEDPCHPKAPINRSRDKPSAGPTTTTTPPGHSVVTPPPGFPPAASPKACSKSMSDSVVGELRSVLDRLGIRSEQDFMLALHSLAQVKEDSLSSSTSTAAAVEGSGRGITEEQGGHGTTGDQGECGITEEQGGHGTTGDQDGRGTNDDDAGGCGTTCGADSHTSSEQESCTAEPPNDEVPSGCGTTDGRGATESPRAGHTFPVSQQQQQLRAYSDPPSAPTQPPARTPPGLDIVADTSPSVTLNTAFGPTPGEAYSSEDVSARTHTGPLSTTVDKSPTPEVQSYSLALLKTPPPPQPPPVSGEGLPTAEVEAVIRKESSFNLANHSWPDLCIPKGVLSSEPTIHLKAGPSQSAPNSAHPVPNSAHQVPNSAHLVPNSVHLVPNSAHQNASLSPCEDATSANPSLVAGPSPALAPSASGFLRPSSAPEIGGQGASLSHEALVDVELSPATVPQRRSSSVGAMDLKEYTSYFYNPTRHPPVKLLDKNHFYRFCERTLAQCKMALGYKTLIWHYKRAYNNNYFFRRDLFEDRPQIFQCFPAKSPVDMTVTLTVPSKEDVVAPDGSKGASADMSSSSSAPSNPTPPAQEPLKTDDGTISEDDLLKEITRVLVENSRMCFFSELIQDPKLAEIIAQNPSLKLNEAFFDRKEEFSICADQFGEETDDFYIVLSSRGAAGAGGGGGGGRGSNSSSSSGSRRWEDPCVRGEGSSGSVGRRRGGEGRERRDSGSSGGAGGGKKKGGGNQHRQKGQKGKIVYGSGLPFYITRPQSEPDW